MYTVYITVYTHVYTYIFKIIIGQNFFLTMADPSKAYTGPHLNPQDTPANKNQIKIAVSKK